MTPVKGYSLSVCFFKRHLKTDTSGITKPDVRIQCSAVSTGNPFILGSIGQGHESQKQCRRGSLHSCEGWLLLLVSESHKLQSLVAKILFVNFATGLCVRFVTVCHIHIVSMCVSMSRQKSARASPQHLHHIVADFIQIGSFSAELQPNASTSFFCPVEYFQYSPSGE